MIDFKEVRSSDSEPQDSDLNDLGRGRFLCRVVNVGTIITVARLEFVDYTKEHGFNVLPFTKAGLTSGVTHWAPSPEMPEA